MSSVEVLLELRHLRTTITTRIALRTSILMQALPQLLSKKQEKLYLTEIITGIDIESK